MAIQKQIQPGKVIKNDGGMGLGVSLNSLEHTLPKNISSVEKKESDDIKAYQHDAIRSIAVSAVAIGIEFALYFSKIIK
jgi:hypothetical protein